MGAGVTDFSGRVGGAFGSVVRSGRTGAVLGCSTADGLSFPLVAPPSLVVAGSADFRPTVAGAGACFAASLMATRVTFVFDACSIGATPGPSLTTTFRDPLPATLRVSVRTLLITLVWLMMVVLLTITLRVRTGSEKRWDSTKTN